MYDGREEVILDSKNISTNDNTLDSNVEANIRVIDPRFKNVFQQIDKGDYQVAAYPKSGSQNDTISLSLNAFIIDSDAVNTVNFDNIGNSITSICSI